ncbi:MAG: hypothetical protein VR73_05925 [Gammaproteobacteria bacterium BRH_c0]|nr:MAG: hypothetical protein VR73_05925 [Gammaproteobacteria bacterium BRH_c0]
MKRAALLIPCLLIGGTEVATLDTARALTELGIDVTVVVYFDETDPVMVATFRQAGIHLQLLGLTRGGAGGTLALIAALTRSLWRKRLALVWVQYMTPTLLPLIVARFFSPHLIAAVHVAARHYTPGGLRRLRWLASWWCNRLVCVSNTTAKGIMGGQPTARLQRAVRVVPNVLDMNAVIEAIPRNWREQLDITGQQPIIGFVGRLAHNKGVDVLLQAATLVNRQYPNAHWIIVGEGEEKPRLQQLAAKNGMEDKVHFVGKMPREDIYSAMKGFDIVVVPSREEGFGLTALEAMACGLPLVASRVDALQEVVIDGQTGLLFTVDDPESLKDCLSKLLFKPINYSYMRIAAAEHAQVTYGKDKLAGKIRNLVFNEK